MKNYKNRQMTNKLINKLDDLENIAKWIDENKTKIFYSAIQYKTAKRILTNVYKNYQIRLNNIEPIEFEQFTWQRDLKINKGVKYDLQHTRN